MKLSTTGKELIKLVEEFIAVARNFRDRHIITMEQYEELTDEKFKFLSQVNEEKENYNSNGMD
jgi:hypothetical protein